MTVRFLKALLLSSLLLSNQPAQAACNQRCQANVWLARVDGRQVERLLESQGLRVELSQQGHSDNWQISSDWTTMQRALELLQSYARQHRLPPPAAQQTSAWADEAISSRPIGLDASSTGDLLLCLNDEPYRLDTPCRGVVQLLGESAPVHSAGPAARAVRGPPA